MACGGIDDPGLVAEVKLLASWRAKTSRDDGGGGVRIARRVAPERVISVVDPDARHGHRSRRDRYDGYKLHISVDVDSDLFVAAAATAATTERSLIARAAAYRLHSLYDSRDLTANARAAFADRFVRHVDPDRLLPEAERQRRAECARKAYYTALAAKSARARRAKREARGRETR